MREKIMKIINDVWNAKVSPVDAEDKILSLIHSEMVGLVQGALKDNDSDTHIIAKDLLSAIEKKFGEK